MHYLKCIMSTEDFDCNNAFNKYIYIYILKVEYTISIIVSITQKLYTSKNVKQRYNPLFLLMQY